MAVATDIYGKDQVRKLLASTTHDFTVEEDCDKLSILRVIAKHWLTSPAVATGAMSVEALAHVAVAMPSIGTSCVRL